MSENIVTVDGVNFSFDEIGYEYSQLDSEASGNSEDGTMYRDVIGLKNKVYCDVTRETLTATEASNYLKLLEKTSATVNYFDLKENKRVTKSLYIVADEIKMKKVAGVIYAKPFQIRFIQMTIDSVS